MIDFLSRTRSHCVLLIFFRHSRAVALVSLLFCIQVSLRAIDQGRSAPAATAPDAEVKELRLEDLTATPKRCRRDTSATTLKVCLRIGPDETLADDYNKSFRYTQADATCGDRLRHFAGQFSLEELLKFFAFAGRFALTTRFFVPGCERRGRLRWRGCAE